jgi:hypothetical protein
LSDQETGDIPIGLGRGRLRFKPIGDLKPPYFRVRPSIPWLERLGISGQQEQPGQFNAGFPEHHPIAFELSGSQLRFRLNLDPSQPVRSANLHVRSPFTCLHLCLNLDRTRILGRQIDEPVGQPIHQSRADRRGQQQQLF